MQTDSSRIWTRITVSISKDDNRHSMYSHNAGGSESKVSIYPTLRHEQDVTQGQFLSRVQLVWIQSFPSPRLVALLKQKNSLPNYSPKAKGRTNGFIPFPRELAQIERLTDSSSILTWITNFIFQRRWLCNIWNLFLTFSAEETLK